MRVRKGPAGESKEKAVQDYKPNKVKKEGIQNDLGRHKLRIVR